MTTLQLPASAGYDSLATVYDLLTADHEHDRWLESLEALCRSHGLRARRVLDVACGTGKSFLPLLDRGYEVTACDISPQMAALAAEKAGDRARVCVADMRELPRLGQFDLITCLNDAINHLVRADDVLAALMCMRENLEPGGLLVFDVNTAHAYATARDAVAEDDGRLVVWRGSQALLPAPGGLAEVLIEIFTETADGLWRRESCRQSHRHYALGHMTALLERAGFQLCALKGQLPGGRLEGTPDERRHHKALFLARRPRLETTTERRTP
jgi:SAM-dependent methyltransferase